MIKFDKKLNYFLYKIYKKLRIIRKKLFCILFSGGVDSNLLTNLMIKFINKKNILIIHINHNYNLLDKKYKKKCKLIFINLKVNSIIVNIKKIKKNRWGTECYLRYKRIKKIKKLIKKNYFNNIWTAENLNDKKENLLISIIRKKFFYKKTLKIKKIKPFIDIKKKNIKKYSLKRFKWLEDSSNLKCINTRNKIRIKIIPLLINLFNLKNFK